MGIRAAFTNLLTAGAYAGKYQTTIVISETEYYLVTWKSVKKVLNVERVSDPEGTQLIGKRFSFRELNAAIAFKRTKSGVETDELYKFDEEMVKLAQIYPEIRNVPVRKQDP